MKGQFILLSNLKITVTNQFLFPYFIFLPTLFFLAPSCTQPGKYPEAQISNQHICMKLYLPDTINGYYRATRFDWSGIIHSLEFKNHQYFGEWKMTHDPLVHEDITGPAESFGSPGLGYDEAEPGGSFIRIGIGELRKIREPEYVWNQTYKLLNHGTWYVDQGKDWIEFQHQLSTNLGWGYIYTKRIDLLTQVATYNNRHQCF